MTTGEAADKLAPGLKTLAKVLKGRIIEPGEPDFESAVLIWNGMIEKTPGAVVQPVSVEDVVATVNFARDNRLELSIKGGGHNIAGLALSDGGVTLDMSRLRDVIVDVESRTARVGPGCTLADVDGATQQHGLATTLGFVSETGVAGLTLGGGFGYLTRQFGWTVDDLIEVELVTAAGEVVRASREEHPDLFWALRGGGGNFGVVTEFVFGLHEIGPEVTGGLIAWSGEHAEEVTELFRRVTERAPRQLTLAMLMRNAPPAPWLDDVYHGEPMIAFVVCHTGPPEQAEDDLAEVRSFGEPWADLIQVKEYSAQQAMLDATQPKGMHYYWKSEFLPGLGDEMLADYRAQFVDMEAPANQIILFHVDGALAGFDEKDGAVGNRDAAYVCVIASLTPPDGPVAANREWVRSAWDDLSKYSTGGNYINFQTADEPDDRLAGSYRGSLDRLAQVKAEWDPENLFRVNRNIKPA
ncbi:MAG TPA: FAD-binding oxidoreductase [Acidimicrobiia bacterium]|nr:FAD-binding oxidoreductase [Acidimicrobiia bacterium]